MMRTLFIYAILLLGIALSTGTMQKVINHNALFVWINKTYTTASLQTTYLTHVTTLMEPHMSKCHITSTANFPLNQFEVCYTSQTLPLHLVGQSITLTADTLRHGSSRADEATAEIVTLFGPGFVQSRLFFVAEQTNSWQIAVNAKHDAPASVLLEIWLGTEHLGTLSFDEGDNTWETLSLSAPIAPGFHNLYIWYKNDFFDPELGLDRNAYIQSLQIMRQDFADE